MGLLPAVSTLRPLARLAVLAPRSCITGSLVSTVHPQQLTQCRVQRTSNTSVKQLSTLKTHYVYNSNTLQAEKLSRKGSLAHCLTQLMKKVSYQR